MGSRLLSMAAIVGADTQPVSERRGFGARIERIEFDDRCYREIAGAIRASLIGKLTSAAPAARVISTYHIQW
jgi:hypothetical protein